MTELKILKDLKTASPLGTMLTLGLKQLQNKKSAEDFYKSLVPLMHEQIKLGKNLQDPHLNKAQDVLSKLPPFGARRRNFNRWYIGSTSKLLTLPHDPDKLTIACWW